MDTLNADAAAISVRKRTKTQETHIDMRGLLSLLACNSLAPQATGLFEQWQAAVERGARLRQLQPRHGAVGAMPGMALLAHGAHP